METPLNTLPATADTQTGEIPVPRIVRPSAALPADIGVADGRMSRYRERAAGYTSRENRFRQLKLEQEVERNRPPSVFLTTKFWRGFLFIGVLNMAVFMLLMGSDTSWLYRSQAARTTHAKAPAFVWPKGMVPLQVERTSDGETLITVPTRTLTPEEQATLRRLMAPKPPISGGSQIEKTRAAAGSAIDDHKT